MSTLELKDAAVTRALITYLQREWYDTIVHCDNSIPRLTGLKSDQTVLHLLKARALFHLAAKERDLLSDTDMPPFGHPDMDLPTLWEAWQEMQITLNLLRESGWPPNAEYLIDVLGATSVILDRHRDILGDLRALAQRRPHLSIVHEQLHRLAILAGDHALALAALDKVRDEGHAMHLRILTLYGHNRYKEALECAKAKLLTADPHHKMHGACLQVAALCAEQVVRPDEATPFVEQLRSRAEWVGELAVYEFVSTWNASPLRRDAAVNAFIVRYREHPTSAIMQDNLFVGLNAQERAHAQLCHEVGERIRARRRLALFEVGHLAQAYVTLSDWGLALDLVQDAMAQYGDVPKLLAIQAVAFEGMGETSRALAILTHLVASQPEDDLAINTYVNICIRNGLHQQALEQLERLLENADTRDAQLAYLQRMFGLVRAVEPTSSRLQAIAWRYGQLADRTIEEQEGIFLLMFTTATLWENAIATDARRHEVRARAEAFFEQFPQSKIIRRFAIPENATATDVKRALSHLLGMTPERERWFTKVENQLQRGELAVPFCWRPKHLLLNVTDVVHLWYMGKHTAKDARAHHLTMATEPNYEELDLPRGLDRPPLIDLMSLLVLYDLHLLAMLFRVFPKIAIPKRTLMEIQTLAHPFPWGYTPLVEIRDLLKTHMAQILQPGSPTAHRQAAASHLDHSLEEIKELMVSGRYTLYMDDAFARAYTTLNSEHRPTMTTLDILAEAERRQWLSVTEVSAKLALLAKWNVGIPVKGRYFLAAIPRSVEGVTDLEELMRLLSSEESFGELAKGLWYLQKDYIEILKHIADILAYIAQNHDAVVELLAAVWAVWLEKVQFRMDIPGTRRMHLARVLMHASGVAQKDRFAVKRLWDAYILLIARMHRHQMDSQREREARQFVGRYAAQIVHRHEDNGLGEQIFQVLSSGLTNGTSEYEAFCKAYEAERIKLLRET